LNPISAKIVEETWMEMGEMEVDDVMSLITKFSKEQPSALMYLMAAGDDIFNEDEREILMYLGTNVWRMMSKGEKPLSMVSDKNLFQAEDVNIKTLEEMMGESPGDFIAVADNLVKNYNQVEILGYLVTALTEEGDDDVEIREDSQGLMLICLKSLLDCLDAA